MNYLLILQMAVFTTAFCLHEKWRLFPVEGKIADPFSKQWHRAKGAIQLIFFFSCCQQDWHYGLPGAFVYWIIHDLYRNYSSPYNRKWNFVGDTAGSDTFFQKKWVRKITFNIEPGSVQFAFKLICLAVSLYLSLKY